MPFPIVNVVAGASKLSLRDFLLGTVLGMAPGIAVMAALGRSPISPETPRGRMRCCWRWRSQLIALCWAAVLVT
jgi:uncharacterized membrane protein YdjX (TVP38/TMEM64 family)